MPLLNQRKGASGETAWGLFQLKKALYPSTPILLAKTNHMAKSEFDGARSIILLQRKHQITSNKKTINYSNIFMKNEQSSGTIRKIRPLTTDIWLKSNRVIYKCHYWLSLYRAKKVVLNVFLVQLSYKLWLNLHWSKQQNNHILIIGLSSIIQQPLPTLSLISSQ